MVFSVPKSAFDMEPEDTFDVESLGNLFLIFMLARNWRSWAKAFRPVASYRKEDLEAVQLEVNSGNEEALWTVIGVDEGEYIEPGVRHASSNGYYTHGFIKSEWSRKDLTWEPDWIPHWTLVNTPGVTLEFDLNVPAKTIWVGCETCSEDDADECEHLSSGSFGTWLSLDSEFTDDSLPEELFRAVAEDESLGPMRFIAIGALVRLCLIPQNREEEVEQWTVKAAEQFTRLPESERVVVTQDLMALPED